MSVKLVVGYSLGTGVEPGVDPVGAARAAERAGFDFVAAADHPVGSEPTYETLTMLAWVAARTERIGICAKVLGVPFRRPAMVAKSAESLQRLSGGRFILGLGGGYDDDEIAALGAPVPSARAKVDGMTDAIEIIHRVWSGPNVTFQGRVHSVEKLTMCPRPEQQIPIWLGTYGPRALAATGRLADGWIPSLGFAPPSAIPEMLDRIHTAAAAADRRPGAVRAIYNVAITIEPRAARATDTLTGSAADVVEQLQEFRALGFSGFNFVVAPGQVEAVGADVLPALR
jgi:alkanesulfonate monooxygenase SsuD/methylene tetrahydromethanopterin reductase-like flavin-dependent oxidoreductase (luciferase family)